MFQKLSTNLDDSESDLSFILTRLGVGDLDLLLELLEVLDGGL